jgi:hypothetical protein
VVAAALSDAEWQRAAAAEGRPAASDGDDAADTPAWHAEAARLAVAACSAAPDAVDTAALRAHQRAAAAAPYVVLSHLQQQQQQQQPAAASLVTAKGSDADEQPAGVAAAPVREESDARRMARELRERRKAKQTDSQDCCVA